MRLAAGLRWGSYSVPRSTSRYKGDGEGGKGRKGLGIGRERREGKDVKGYGGMKRGRE